MEKFILSFCIPTYKRPHLLLKAIESMIDSATDYLEQVQIVITDDSTDNTNEWVIDKVKDKIKHLKYIKNHSNLGIDGNILHAIDSSDGEFIWIIGEDDLVCQGAVKNFISINKSDYAFICSNYSYVAADQKKMLKENVIGLSINREVKPSELLENYSWSFGFIGACIINKKVWRTVDSSKYQGTFFAHVGTILESVKNANILMLATPSVLNRCGDSNVTTWGAEHTFEVMSGWAELMKRLHDVYPESSCEKSVIQFERKLGANSLAFLFSKRADEVYTKEIYQKFYQKSKRGSFYKMVALMILSFNPSFCQKIRNVKRYVKSLNHA